MFFEEFKALIAKTLWQKAHTQVHAEHSGNNLIRFFTSESKHSLCLSRAWIWQTKGNVFLHICCICSESFPALLFLHFPSLYPISCSWMRQCRRYLIFFFQRSVPEFTASQGFHWESSGLTDHNRGRHCMVLTHWKCKISYSHFCRWLPNYI